MSGSGAPGFRLLGLLFLLLPSGAQAQERPKVEVVQVSAASPREDEQ